MLLWKRVPRPAIGASCLAAAIYAVLCCGSAQAQTAEQTADALFRVGVGNLAAGRYPEARMVFRKLLETQPCHSKGMLGIAEIYIVQKQPDEAITQVEHEMENCQFDPGALQAYGDVLLRIGGHEDRALELFQKALPLVPAKSPELGQLYLRIAQAQGMKKKMEPWNEALEHARELLPKDPQVLVARAIYQDAKGDKSGAMASYREALALQPDNGQTLNNLAYLMAEQNQDLDRALDYARRARNLLPEVVDVDDTIGWIYARKRWADSAILVLKSVIAREPGKELYRGHMLEALEIKDFGKVGSDLKEALKEPVSPENIEKVKALVARLK